MKKGNSIQGISSLKYVKGQAYNLYLQYKYKWIEWLEEQSAKMSNGQLRISLVSFFVLGLLGCTYSVYRGIRGYAPPTVVLEPVRVLTPLPPEESFPVVTDSAFSNAIPDLNHFLDRLRNPEEGLIFYDSIQRLNPGFLDSIKMFTHYYTYSKMKNYETRKKGKEQTTP